MIRSLLICGTLAPFVASAAAAATVSVPAKTQPESITIAPNGDLILGSSNNPKIYRARQGADKAAVFVDASAEVAVVAADVSCASDGEEKHTATALASIAMLEVRSPVQEKSPA